MRKTRYVCLAILVALVILSTLACQRVKGSMNLKSDEVSKTDMLKKLSNTNVTALTWNEPNIDAEKIFTEL